MRLVKAVKTVDGKGKKDKMSESVSSSRKVKSQAAEAPPKRHSGDSSAEMQQIVSCDKMGQSPTVDLPQNCETCQIYVYIGPSNGVLSTYNGGNTWNYASSTPTTCRDLDSFTVYNIQDRDKALSAIKSNANGEYLTVTVDDLGCPVNSCPEFTSSGYSSGNLARAGDSTTDITAFLTDESGSRKSLSFQCVDEDGATRTYYLVPGNRKIQVMDAMKDATFVFQYV